MLLLQVGTGNLTHATLTPSIVNYGFEEDMLTMTANGSAEVRGLPHRSFCFLHITSHHCCPRRGRISVPET